MIKVHILLTRLDGQIADPTELLIGVEPSLTLIKLKDTVVEQLKDPNIVDLYFTDRDIVDGDVRQIRLETLLLQRESYAESLREREPILALPAIIIEQKNLDVPSTEDVSFHVLCNPFFRRILQTSDTEQSAAMCLLPTEEIPQEEHKNIDQKFFVLTGKAEFIVGDKSTPIDQGGEFSIPQGTLHTVKNRSRKKLLRLFTVYSLKGAEDMQHAHKEGEINIRQWSK